MTKICISNVGTHEHTHQFSQSGQNRSRSWPITRCPIARTWESAPKQWAVMAIVTDRLLTFKTVLRGLIGCIYCHISFCEKLAAGPVIAGTRHVSGCCVVASYLGAARHLCYGVYQHPPLQPAVHHGQFLYPKTAIQLVISSTYWWIRQLPTVHWISAGLHFQTGGVY